MTVGKCWLRPISDTVIDDQDGDAHATCVEVGAGKQAGEGISEIFFNKNSCLPAFCIASCTANASQCLTHTPPSLFVDAGKIVDLISLIPLFR